MGLLDRKRVETFGVVLRAPVSRLLDCQGLIQQDCGIQTRKYLEMRTRSLGHYSFH